jgi:DNA-directed RNA polymerase specialized sigma24 family protein
MAGDLWPKTRWTLLRDLAHAGSETDWNRAWARFVDEYCPGILIWCRKWGLHQHEDEICQAVLGRMFPAMRTYEFRRWFGCVLQSAAAELLADSPDELCQVIQRRQGQDQPEQRLKQEWLARIDDATLEQLTMLSRLHYTEAEQLALDVRALLQTSDAASPEGKLLIAAKAAIGRGSLLDILERGEEAGLPEDEGILLANLKHRLAVAHRAAWAEEWAALEGLFRPVFWRWCQDEGMSAAETESVTRKLLPLMRRTAEGLDAATLPKFRSWLFKIMDNAAKDSFRDLAKAIPGGGVALVDEVLHNPAAQADFTTELMRQEVRSLAADRVRQTVNPVHWEVYWMMVHEGVPGKDAAARLNLANPASVWQTVKRVRDKVREEILALEKRAAAEEEA